MENLQDEIKRLNAALLSQADVNEQWKNKFISGVSHELRTPLATIKLSINYLLKYRNKLADAAVEEKLKTISQQIDFVAHSVENLVALKQGEQKIQLSKRLIDVNFFFEHLIAEIEKRTNRSHTILYQSDNEIKEVFADEDMLNNIFSNLLTNAIKFSPGEANAWLTVRNKAGNIEVEVKDKGVGINDAEISKIFDSFFRGSNSNGIEGMGLGLSIVKRGVDAMKGEIKINSKEGSGTSVIITLPMKS